MRNAAAGSSRVDRGEGEKEQVGGLVAAVVLLLLLLLQLLVLLAASSHGEGKGRAAFFLVCCRTRDRSPVAVRRKNARRSEEDTSKQNGERFVCRIRSRSRQMSFAGLRLRLPSACRACNATTALGIGLPTLLCLPDVLSVCASASDSPYVCALSALPAALSRSLSLEPSDAGYNYGSAFTLPMPACLDLPACLLAPMPARAGVRCVWVAGSGGLLAR